MSAITMKLLGYGEETVTPVLIAEIDSKGSREALRLLQPATPALSSSRIGSISDCFSSELAETPETRVAVASAASGVDYGVTPFHEEVNTPTMLTDLQIKNLKRPTEGRRKYWDSRGLYLLLTPRSSAWRFKYSRDKKEQLLSLGTYPAVNLTEARVKAQVLRTQLTNGIDPSEHRKKHAAARIDAREQTFGVIGQELLQLDDTKAPRTRKKAAWLFSLMRSLHARPIAELKTVDLVKVLKAIEASGDRRETAHRCAQFAGSVFRYAIQNDYTNSNPAANLRGALKPIKTESHAAITDPARFARLLQYLNNYDLIAGHSVVAAALKLAPLLFVRPGELRQAEWSEFDLEKAEWLLPASKTKMRRPHLVPLARQAVEMLKTQQLLTGGGRYVFPGRNNPHRPLSDAALSVALKKIFFMSDEHTPHGFRASASTLLNGELKYDSALIELQLAHAKKDKVAAIYDRSQRIPERSLMMQAWADYLDKLRATPQN